MCGIAGIVLSRRTSDVRRLCAVDAMTASLRHRGPDGGDTWVDADAGVALGHRRLAIIDLSDAGRQPMVSHDGHLVMTFNGEIYNFDELRLGLESAGHRFRGHSDTEVMLAAFERSGIATTLHAFVGMFAFGVWDRRSRTLHLVRDRLGKKPLYVGLSGSALLFASELKAFRAFPGFQPVIDHDALGMFMDMGWVPEHHCIWHGVAKLPPGSMLSLPADELDGLTIDELRGRIRVWWSLAEVVEDARRHPPDLSEAEIATELDGILRTAVRQRMVADVPLGALLSGGVDSSTVVALMQAQSPRPVRTFTIGFREERYNEAADAKQVARHLGTDHTELYLTAAEAWDALPELPRIWDEPFADVSQLPTFLVARLAREHVTVALSGDGGDESFAGYNRHRLAGFFDTLFRLPWFLRRGAAGALQSLENDSWDRLLQTPAVPAALRRSLAGDSLHKLADVLEARDERDLYDRYMMCGPRRSVLNASAAAESTSTAEGAHLLDRLDAAARVMYRDMTGYLPGDILTKLDRASMAAALEARCPLLDHRVVEFAWRLPTEVKVRSRKGKRVLRRVLRRYVPEALFDRPKQGFNVPVGLWLKGPLRDWAEGMLCEKRLRSEGLLDPDRVRACWQEHLTGRRDRQLQLWVILMFQAWFDAGRMGMPTPTYAPAARPTALP